MSARAFRILLLTVCCGCPGASCLGDHVVWERTVRSTVWILSDSGSGTGVIVRKPDGNLVVATACHVVDGGSNLKCYFPEFTDDGTIVTDRLHYVTSGTGHAAKILRVDPQRDLALLLIENLPAGTVAIECATTLRPGSEIHIVGNSGVGTLFGYAFGHVRGVVQRSSGDSMRDPAYRRAALWSDHLPDERPVEAEYIVTDAAVNEGDSGGPAVCIGSGGNPELVGLTQSYGPGRLISTLVSVRELTGFLNEQEPVLDAQVGKNLDALGMDYTVNVRQQFEVNLDEIRILIDSETFDADGQLMRAVTGGILSARSAVPVHISEFLLKANGALRRGRFQITEGGDDSVCYVVEIPADASPEQLNSELSAVAARSRKIQEQILLLKSPAEVPPLPLP